jgi:SAM-dependent methyltransferase
MAPFAARLLDLYTGAALTQLIDVGHRTGLFEAAAAGPATSAELAARAGLEERYVREWLGGMTTGRIVSHDPASGRYTLPAEHARLLTGPGASNLAPMSQWLGYLTRHVPGVADCFRQGGGVPYAAYRPDLTELMDGMWRRIYDEHLVDGFIGRVPGLRARLEAGIEVADAGCGSGHAVNLMAQAFPRSRLTGWDIGEEAVSRGAAEAHAMGLGNARFELRDIRRLPRDQRFDLVTAFDSIHDQVAPATVLQEIHEVLAPDGLFLMVDFRFRSRVEDNLDNPFAPLYYTISTLHCLTVSLAHGGTGLGTVWGEEVARRMLAEAGFRGIEILDSPRPQNCIYVCTP